MDAFEAITKRRSVRQFRQERVPEDLLRKLAEAARLAPSGANLQPSEFIVVTKPELVDALFPLLRWAGYLRPAWSPPAGARPAAYVVAVINRNRKETGARHDVSAAIENILIAAAGEGLGSCWLGSVDRPQIQKLLGIPDYCEVDSVIALGFPAEEPVLEESRDNVRYWRDKDGRLHVPKRPLDDILHWNRF